MFTALHLENYKSFRTLDLNLQTGNNPKNIVAIYGENGSGKSNIISAFTSLCESLDTVNSQEVLANLQKKMIGENNENEFDPKESFLRKIISEGKVINRTLREIFSDAKMIGSKESMVIRFDFKINNKNGCYELIFKSGEDGLYLASERLKYLIKKASGEIYHITGDESGRIAAKWSPSLFNKKADAKLAEDNVQRLWGRHSFLAIFNNMSQKINPQYLKNNVLSGFLTVLSSFWGLSYRDDQSSKQQHYANLLPNIVQGKLSQSRENTKRIVLTQEIINKYFVPLYSDIIHLSYHIVNQDNGTMIYELFEEKRIGDDIVHIPFRIESNGTRKLAELLPLLLSAMQGQTVVVDEIDQGIHDLLMDRLIDNIKDDLQGQLIFTTHDTQVMKQLDLASVYVIQSDAAGNKQVISLSHADKQIGANNNVQKLYLEGFFSGIPYTDDVDFDEILQDLEG